MTPLKKFSFIYAVALFALLTVPASSVLSQTSVQSQIAAIEKEIASLKAALASLVGSLPDTAEVFTVSLQIGSTHYEVRTLQEFLRGMPGVYPEGLVTGYYGPLTAQAVQRFQAQNGIPALGIVGPQTREALNAQYRSALVRVSEPAVPEPAPSRQTVRSRSSYALDPRPAFNRARIEQEIHDRINEERAHMGLRELLWSDDLAKVARNHSGDQAEDNETLTDPDLACAYPVIRHAGFVSGASVGDRVRNAGISFRSVGENIVGFPLTERQVYRYRASESPVSCPRLARPDPEETSMSYIRDVIEEREDVLDSLEPVEWVNREWLNEEEIAEKAVRLWLDSPGHRDNMLDPDFREGGVGLAFVNNYVIITHVLAER